MNIQPFYSQISMFQSPVMQNRITNPSFCNKTNKIIELIKRKRPNEVSITFEQAKNIYESLNYKIVYKRGSHVSIPLGEDKNITLVIPHKGRKYIYAKDVERLKHILAGNIERALNVR